MFLSLSFKASTQSFPIHGRAAVAHGAVSHGLVEPPFVNWPRVVGRRTRTTHAPATATAVVTPPQYAKVLATELAASDVVVRDPGGRRKRHLCLLLLALQLSLRLVLCLGPPEGWWFLALDLGCEDEFVVLDDGVRVLLLDGCTSRNVHFVEIGQKALVAPDLHPRHFGLHPLVQGEGLDLRVVGAQGAECATAVDAVKGAYGQIGPVGSALFAVHTLRLVLVQYADQFVQHPGYPLLLRYVLVYKSA